jgi:hypothetical protein
MQYCAVRQESNDVSESHVTYFSYFLLGLLFDLESGDNTVIRNIGGLLPEQMTLYRSQRCEHLLEKLGMSFGQYGSNLDSPL